MHFQPGFLPHQAHRTTKTRKKLRMSLPIWNPLMISRRKQARTPAGADWTARANMTTLKKGIQEFSLLLLKHSRSAWRQYQLPGSHRRGSLCAIVSEHFFQSLFQRFVKWTGVIKGQLKAQIAQGKSQREVWVKNCQWNFHLLISDMEKGHWLPSSKMLICFKSLGRFTPQGVTVPVMEWQKYWKKALKKA